MQVRALIEHDSESGGFVASVPGFPGCYSDGETIAEARTNIAEALALWIEVTNEVAIEEFGKKSRAEIVNLDFEPALVSKAA